MNTRNTKLAKATRQTIRLTKKGQSLTEACIIVRRRFKLGGYQLFHALTQFSLTS